MDFTDILFLETKEFHKQVDKHQFTYLIKHNRTAADIYIDFNKLCIYNIFKTLEIKDDLLYNKLKKNFILPQIIISHNFNTLLLKCQKFPLEHCYMFILGLISGGNILKKYISKDHHDFLTFDQSSILSKDFKNYLNNYIINKELFIQNVKDSYILIETIFQEFILCL